MSAYTFWTKVANGEPVNLCSGRKAIVLSTHRTTDFVKSDEYRDEDSPLVLASYPTQHYMAVLDLPQGMPPFQSNETTIPVSELIPYN